MNIGRLALRVRGKAGYWITGVATVPGYQPCGITLCARRKLTRRCLSGVLALVSEPLQLDAVATLRRAGARLPAAEVMRQG